MLTKLDWQAIRRGNVTPSDIADATTRMRAVSSYLEQMARELPASSVAHIYASLSRVFCSQLQKIVSPAVECGGQSSTVDSNTEALGWMRTPDEASDPFKWFDMRFLYGDQTNFGAGDEDEIEQLRCNLFL